jgi:GxxExxY protein
MDADGTQEIQPRIDADFTRIGSLGDRLLYRELTEKMLGAAFAVHRELGPGFLEKVYVTALIYELIDRGLSAIAESEIPVSYKGRLVGNYFADILVEGKILCEIKAIRALANEHQAQLLHYLTATAIPVGLLLNFSTPSLQFKRLAKTK